MSTKNTEEKSQNNQDYILEDQILKGPEIPTDLKSSNIGELLLDAFSENPDHVSQIDTVTGDKTTLAEMKERSIRCALWMEKEGLGRDDVVTHNTHNQFDAYIPVFATYFVQAVMNPWMYNSTSEQVRDWLERYEPKLIFVRVEAVDVIEEALSLAKMSTKSVVFGEHPKYPSLNEIIQSQSSIDVANYRPSKRKSPREVAIILHSSGSTGQPKGVMTSAEALLRIALDPNLRLRGKNVFWYAPSHGIMCNSMMLACIFQNATRIISNSSEPREICRIIEKFKVNYAHINPAALNPLARFEEMNKYNLDCLEIMRTSGTKVNRVTYQKLKSRCLRDKIYQGYVTTEIVIMPLQPRFNRSSENHNSVGFVSTNIHLKIIDKVTKKTLGTNVPGEMCIKSPTMFLGYYNNPEATSKAIDVEGWYHTGDLGYYDETGEIFFMGRITDVFEYDEQDIFTNEVEDILWEHPAVENLTVVPVPRESVGQVPVAFVVIRPGENVTENEMNELLKTSDKYKTLPLRVQFIGKMPLTSSLKVAKGYLIEQVLKSCNGYI